MRVKFTKHFPFFNARMICIGNTTYYKLQEKYRERLIVKPSRLNTMVQHERTHKLQQSETLYVFFPVLYLLEWIFKLPTLRPYWNLSFEREARHCQKEPDNYDHQLNHDKEGKVESIDYFPKNEQGSLINRKHYSWTKYIFHE